MVLNEWLTLQLNLSLLLFLCTFPWLEREAWIAPSVEGEENECIFIGTEAVQLKLTVYEMCWILQMASGPRKTVGLKPQTAFFQNRPNFGPPVCARSLPNHGCNELRRETQGSAVILIPDKRSQARDAQLLCSLRCRVLYQTAGSSICAFSDRLGDS